MANQTPIAKWVFANRATFHPTVEQLTWPDRYFPGVHDFATTIEVSGTKVCGHGADHDQMLAIEKSFAEAIERLICARLGINSEGLAVGFNGRGGFAVGFDEENVHSVEEHALNEAFERYFFFRHLREGIHFRSAGDDWDCVCFKKITDKFRVRNKKFDLPLLYKFATPEGMVGYVVAIDRGGQPAFLGLAYGQDVEATIWHAFLEAMPNFARFRDSPFTFDAEVVERGYWNCDPKSLAEVGKYTRCGVYPNPVKEWPAPREINIDLKQIPELVGAPITVVKFVVDENKEKGLIRSAIPIRGGNHDAKAR